MKENKKEGKVTLIKMNENEFEGIFKEDKEYEGDGYIYYENGDIYNGHKENGLKEGKGILIKSNGDKFEGAFKKDKEYTGINFLYNNKIRIEKGNIKESELTLWARLTVSTPPGKVVTYLGVLLDIKKE